MSEELGIDTGVPIDSQIQVWSVGILKPIHLMKSASLSSGVPRIRPRLRNHDWYSHGQGCHVFASSNQSYPRTAFLIRPARSRPEPGSAFCHPRRYQFYIVQAAFSEPFRSRHFWRLWVHLCDQKEAYDREWPIREFNLALLKDANPGDVQSGRMSARC